MFIYYLVFIFFVSFSLVGYKLTPLAKKQLLIFSGIILVLFAGLRGYGVDNDYKNYEDYYKSIPNIHDLLKSNIILSSKLEITFVFIGSIIKYFFNSGFAILIFIYAFLGISLKINAISKISQFPLLSLLIYFSSLFFLQDMTQIRAGVALGFIFLSFISLYKKKNVEYFTFILLATLFHYSSLIFIISFFLNKKKINKWLYLIVIFLPILLNLSGYNFVNILTLFDLGIYTEKLNDYIIAQNWLKASINLFNFSILFQLIMSILFIFMCEKLDDYYAILFTKLFSIGIAVFYIFSFSPVLAFRLSEYLTSVQIFLLPLLVKKIKPRYLPEIIIISISVLYFINQMIINNIFNPYHSIFKQ